MIILNTQKRITAFCVLGLVLILINCSTTAETLQESKIHDMEFVLVAGKTPTPTPTPIPERNTSTAEGLGIILEDSWKLSGDLG